ncbi:G-type lectin S-receptor-like serine/threonine-protein kinase [Prunus yedoensis var. nudiflora]|uniref:G-type lectin S-receptor-like serine/threonine-protein kinase n=1 Tax=Prunus yedoensis var. nudiflora TaxID=2094558 RepID=A0A314ZQ08_PRUYE|nr:G-type lectin S-receptor-like serine/threonine-protein kinase [Prunus yedoensis var. nudiflora]
MASYLILYSSAPPFSKIDRSVQSHATYFTGELKPGQKEDLELPLFDLAAVVCATKNFSNNNKLGEGGFGSVFKDYGYKSYIERLQHMWLMDFRVH